MVPVNNLVLETVIYGSLWNSKSGKIKIKETQNLNLMYLWQSVNLETQNPGSPTSSFKIVKVDFLGNLKSAKLKIRETPKSGKLKIRETQNVWNSKCMKLKIREAKNPGNKIVKSFSHNNLVLEETFLLLLLLLSFTTCWPYGFADGKN